jgi:Fic family protein
MLGDKIKLYRESLKLTQNEVAEALEVSTATISKYESGILEPNIASLKKLASLFDILIDELLNDKDDFDVSNINVLDILREQKEMQLKGNLYHQTQISFAYNTNHIEGSTLTEEQTRYIYETNSILFEGDTIVKTDDILETLNHFMLVDYMIDYADKKLSEKMIKEFHRILKWNTSDSKSEWFNVGEYKQRSNTIGNGIKTTSPGSVEKEIGKLLEWYNSLKQISIKELIEFHYRFESIHPFQDGNGRIGRIILFKECLKNNIIPFIINDKDKLFYYRGLKEYKNEKGYLIDTCLNAQDQYIKMIEYYFKGRK